MGFALIGLAAGTEEGIQGVLVYMTIYVAMTLGTFACIISMRRNDKPFEDIADLAGLARTKPAQALALAILMFSLAGIPPTAGFYAKLAVLSAAVTAGYLWLAVAAVVLSLIGAFYYLRIVKLMYFDDPKEGAVAPGHPEMRWLLSANGLLLLIFGIAPSMLMNVCFDVIKAL
jgi:NADH-quinone oxidoreductase subunit N